MEDKGDQGAEAANTISLIIKTAKDKETIVINEDATVKEVRKVIRFDLDQPSFCSRYRTNKVLVANS